MRKVLVLGALLSLFSVGNVIASELPVEITSETNAYVDNVNYSVTNIYTEYENGNYATAGYYLHFTVNWEYTGNRPQPQVAFIIKIYDGTYLEKSFQDSALGMPVGSRDYKIKVSRDTYYNVVIDGSDGYPY